MKQIIKLFLITILLVPALQQANSVYDFVKITDDKAYFLKYSQINTAYFEKIQDGSITFMLKGNNPSTEFHCGEVGCFFSTPKKHFLKDTGLLIIKHNKKMISFPYELTFNKKKQKAKKLYNFLTKEEVIDTPIQIASDTGIDISERMLYKSIQERTLSCEISATADILSYLTGREIKENHLLDELPRSQYNALPTEKNNKKYWGDPQSGFVGYIDTLPDGETARQRHMTGYGVLEKPIDTIIKKYGFKTKILTQYNYLPTFGKKEHLTLILQELKKGNMIQLWGDICTNPKYFNGKENGCTYAGRDTWNDERKISWYYKDSQGKEKKYTGLNGEHAFYLLGYKGDITDPTHIIVWDTYTGKHTYVTSEWMRKWKKMQYRSIIVYAN